MPATSISALLEDKNSVFMRAAQRMTPPEDMLRGRIDGGSSAPQLAPTRPSKGLDERLGVARQHGFRKPASGKASAFDARQRAIVKVHYFSHGSGGGALAAHARYVSRDAAQQERDEREDRQAELDAHTRYLARDQDRSVFYDADGDRIDGAARVAEWANRDKRHFRIILAAEEGERLKDLRPFVREVMARAELALGSKLQWIAVDHHDTDNPHTHVILRGRSAGAHANFRLPKDFVQHGFRAIARDVATERLGERTRVQHRDALEKEARAHRPTRLDALLAPQIEQDGALRIARIRAPDRDPDVTRALKTRARELRRLGLAEERARNVLAFSPDWRERLTALEHHLDIRKQLMRGRAPNQAPKSKLPPGLGRDR